MWAIIKKAINSTLGTAKFKPLDIFIEDIVNNDGDKALNEMLFGDKQIIADSNKLYGLIDSFSASAKTTTESNKRLFIHAKGTVTFKTDAGTLKVYKNGFLQSSNDEINVECHDYFDFAIENNTNNDITASITMHAKGGGVECGQ
jgi:hypothetical protein